MFSRNNGADICLELSGIVVSGFTEHLNFKTPQLVFEADGEVLKVKDLEKDAAGSGVLALRSTRSSVEFADVKPGVLSITLRESLMRSILHDRSASAFIASADLQDAREDEPAQLEVCLQGEDGGAASGEVTLQLRYFFRGLPPKPQPKAQNVEKLPMVAETTAVEDTTEKTEDNGNFDLLIVTVVSAKDLKPPRGTDCDPFVKLAVYKPAGEPASEVPEQTTRVIYDSVSCTWNETFYFPVKGEANVSLEVLDKNRITFDALIGLARVDIGEAWLESHRSAGQDLWIELSDPKESGMLTSPGKLRLRVRATTFNENPFLSRDLEKLPQGAQYDAAVADHSASDDSDEELEPDDSVHDEEAEKKDAELPEGSSAEDEALQRLLTTRMEEGAYQAQIHVIEVRNLNAEDVDGTSDPMLRVSCFDQTAYSKPKYNCTSCVFDELYTFENENAKRRELETEIVTIDVLSVNTLTKSMIGTFTVSLFNIYAREDHELYRMWVPLVDMTSSKDTGIQGFMRLSIQILGPGDAPKIHDRVKEKLAITDKASAAAGLSGTLSQAMPMLKQTLRFLVVAIFRGEWLPPSDHSMSGRAAGGDFRIGIQFGIHDVVKTKVHSSTKNGRITLNIKERLWIPYMEPCFDNNVKIFLYDNDHLVKDELVSSAMVLNLRDIKREPDAFDLVYLNLYGPPGTKPSLPSKAYNDMLKYPETGSAYRGRLLVSVREVGPGDTQDGRPRKGRKPRQQRSFRYKIKKSPTTPAKIDYTIKFDVFMATDLPAYNTGNQFSVALSWGPIGAESDELSTSFEPAYRGSAVWNHSSSQHGVMFQQFQQSLGRVAVRRAEMPDIFVYVVRQDPMKFKKVQKIAFARLRYDSCAYTGDSSLHNPQWIELRKCPVVNNIPSGQSPGSLLLRVLLGPTTTFSKVPADHEFLSVDKDKALYKVLVHVFQARQLPPSDLNGSIDPYVVVRFNGQRKKLEHVSQSCDPVFNETIEFNTVMYKASTLKPRITFDVYDADTWNEDDFVGTVTTPIQAQEEDINDWNDLSEPWPPVKPRPKALALMRNGAPTKSLLLVGFQLVRGPDKSESFGASPLSSPAGRERDAKVSTVMQLGRPLPPDYCKPLERLAYVEVIGLGLRDLKSSSLRGIQNPSLELRLGTQTLTMKPSPGAKSSNTDPNFLTRSVFETTLPLNTTYMPSMSIAVREGFLSGFGVRGSILGSSSISLASFVPRTIAAEHEAEGSPVPGASGSVFVPNPKFEPNGASARVGNPFRPSDPSNRSVRKRRENENDSATNKEQSEEEKLRKKISDAITPSFLKGREILDHEIEVDVGHLPWREYPIYRGIFSLDFLQSAEQESLEDSIREVGTFKGLIRVLDKDPKTVAPDTVDYPTLPRAVEDLFGGSVRDRTIHVHLYILEGLRLRAGDTSGRADPYLRIRWGDDVINLRGRGMANTLEPQFYERIDLKIQVPGTATVWIDVLDADGLGAGGGSIGLGLKNDLIGSTCIDLEDRWFSEKWHEMGNRSDGTEAIKRPVETRELYSPEEGHSQGALRMWIDMVPASQFRSYVPIPISPPQQEEWEVRMIVWKANFRMRSIGADMVTGMIDMYFKGKLADQQPQDTDTHIRIKNGKGSWNWRMKFPVSLPAAATDEGGGYFHLEAWDMDMLWNEALGRVMIDLSSDFQKAYLAKRPYVVFEERAKAKKLRGAGILRNVAALKDIETGAAALEEKRSMADETTPLLAKVEKPQKSKAPGETETLWTRIKSGVGLLGENPPGAQWMNLKKQIRPDADPVIVGQVLLSIELLPKSVADVRPAGFGRAEPNSNPALSEPEGRPDFTKMWNPLYLLQVCVGEGLMIKFCCLFTCLGFLALSFFVGPVFLQLFQLALSIPSAGPVLMVAVGVFLLSCAYTVLQCRRVCCVPEDPDDCEFEDEEAP